MKVKLRLVAYLNKVVFFLNLFTYIYIFFSFSLIQIKLSIEWDYYKFVSFDALYISFVKFTTGETN